MKNRLMAVFLILAFSCVSAEKNKSVIPYLTEIEKGFVPNEDVAIELAKIYFTAIYGGTVMKIKKYQAELHDDIWYVKGLLEERQIGGYPYIKINKQDGKVLGIMYTK